jgi:hypothetical protein
MICTIAKSKRSESLKECRFRIYENKDLSGKGATINILPADWMFGNNNRMEDPRYAKNETVKDGKQLPRKSLKIYDNDGNLIPNNSKLRVYSYLLNASGCGLGAAEKIEKIA